MTDALTVFIGWDSGEVGAFDVASHSLQRRASAHLPILPIRLADLRASGLYTRPTEHRNGQLWDVRSNAPMSTEFAISRFFVPLIAPPSATWVLFVDSDIVALTDPLDILKEADPHYALQCVQHPPLRSTVVKKLGKTQTSYPRKNWSSVMLWNLAHGAHTRLTAGYLNTVPGRTLHAFDWLNPSEIGHLEPRWNWLVGVQAKPADPAIAHFTLGGPWLEGWRAQPHDELWCTEARALVGAT